MKWWRRFWDWLFGRKTPKPAPEQPVIIPIQEPIQNDRNMRWFLLDTTHANYAATVTTLTNLTEGHGRTLTTTASRYTDVNVVYAYCTEQQRDAASPSLAIGAAAVLDEVNYSKCVNPNYDGEVSRTNEWGDTYTLYGKFLQPPQRLPTTGYDRLVAWWKNTGSDTVLYVNQSGSGDESGDSYANAKSVHDILSVDFAGATHDPTNYTILVLCGRLSRFRNEGKTATTGTIGFLCKTGTSGTRTQILAHSVDGAQLMGGCKLGSGTASDDADWTDDDGAWYCNHASGSVSTGQYYVMSDAGGTLRPLTKVASVAACKALADSYFVDTTRTYANLADDSNPRTTTYFIRSIPGVQFLTYNTEYFDVFGVEFYQQGWSGTNHKRHSDWAAYGCKWQYSGAGKLISADEGYLEEGTGVFRWSSSGSSTRISYIPKQIQNRKIIGCVIAYTGDGLYDFTGHDLAPSGTLVRDTHFYGVGIEQYGINNANVDSHSVGCFGGFKGLTVYNNRFERCGRFTQVIYIIDNNFDDPTLTISDGAFTNGTFDSDTAWTKGGTATISGGKANFAANGDYVEQMITLGASYLSTVQVINFVLPASGSLNVSVGTTSGGTDILASTSYTADTAGNACFSFTPNGVATDYYVRFTETGAGTLDNVELLTSLQNQVGFTQGYPASKRYEISAGVVVYTAPAYDILIQYNLFTDPVTDNSATSYGNTCAVGLNGEKPYGYGSQIYNVKVLDNRAEGEFHETIRCLWMVPSPYDATQVEIARNTIRGAEDGIRVVQNKTDENGNTVEVSLYFHHNDVHVTGSFIVNSNYAQPTYHNQIFDYNTYRNDDGANWAGASGSTWATLALWRASAPAGDTRDTNSTHVALGA